MNDAIKKIYEKHHRENRGAGFVLFGEERGALLEKYIGTGKKVLDIGCRDGSLAKYFFHGNEVWGADLDEESLARARVLGLKTVLMDLNGDWGELAEEKFDVVVAGEILEHLYYPEAVIKKVAKHLKDDGIFLGSVPNAFSLKNRLRYLLGRKRFTPLADPTHINHFGFGELAGLLGKSFERVEIVGLGKYKKLIRFSPGFFAFILFFYVKFPKHE